jgi:hypothetical protein
MNSGMRAFSNTFSVFFVQCRCWIAPAAMELMDFRRLKFLNIKNQITI